MASRLFPTETTGNNPGPGPNVSTNDHNEQIALNTRWDTVAVTAAAITIAGDGKYNLTHGSATNLDSINFTLSGDGYQGIIARDASSTGDLTIRDTSASGGNIRTQFLAPIPVVDTETLINFVLRGGLVYVWPVWRP